MCTLGSSGSPVTSASSSRASDSACSSPPSGFSLNGSRGSSECGDCLCRVNLHNLSATAATKVFASCGFERPSLITHKQRKKHSKAQDGHRGADRKASSRQTLVNVDGLASKLRFLSPKESAVAILEDELQRLDSRALSALLKDLHSTGRGDLAVEIFDWLRQRPDDDKLRKLCDVYSYTTMISQCGVDRQLHRALTLAAEMRSRSIPCNVHTYSSLMNVCTKAGEYRLANDVYQQMLSEGLTPSMVTFNTLIDMYGKCGKWQDALKVMKLCKEKGITADLRTYNTLMIACNWNGRYAEAVDVANEMRHAGMTATSTTYQSWVTAYARHGHLEVALEVFKEMLYCGSEKVALTCNVLLSACETFGRCDVAFEALESMQRVGTHVAPSALAAVIGSCVHGGELLRARRLFEDCCSKGCLDAKTCNHIVLLYCKRQLWKDALLAIQGMQAQGLNCTSSTVHAMIDTLMHSGIIPVQSVAASLYRQISAEGNSDCTTCEQIRNVRCFVINAGYPSVALFELCNVLTELRAFSRTNSGWILDEVLIRFRGNATKSKLEERLSGLENFIRATASPLKLLVASPSECQLSCSSAALAPWLASRGLLDWLEHAGIGAHASVEQTCDVVAIDSSCEANSSEVLQVLQDSGADSPLNVKGLPAWLVVRLHELATLAGGYAVALQLPESCIWDATQLLLKVTSTGLTVPEVHVEAVLQACLVHVARTTCPEAVDMAVAALSAVCQVPVAQLLNVEVQLAAFLQANTRAASALTLLHVFLQRLGVDAGQGSTRACSWSEMAAMMLSVALLSVETWQHRPSALAAAALQLCRQHTGVHPAWPDALHQLTGYTGGCSEIKSATSTLTQVLKSLHVEL